VSRFVKISRVLRSDHDLTTERDAARETLQRAQAERNKAIDRAEAAEEKISQLRHELDNAEEERERERIRGDKARECLREAGTVLAQTCDQIRKEHSLERLALLDELKTRIAERDAARAVLRDVGPFIRAMRQWVPDMADAAGWDACMADIDRLDKAITTVLAAAKGES
jgi:chromosome segregation ATPase